jgi:cysteine synthase A
VPRSRSQAHGRPSAFPELVTSEVNDEDAIAMTRRLIRCGFPVGPSSGLNVVAVQSIARRLNSDRVVTVFPDRTERFTTEMFGHFAVK